MVKEYLKKLKQDLVDEVERTDSLFVTVAENAKLNKEVLIDYSENIRQNNEVLMALVPSSEEVIENSKNMPSMAPFSLDENGKIVPVENSLSSNISRRRQ